MPIEKWFIGSWIPIEQKFGFGKCVICNESIPKGENCLWKTNTIVHTDCLSKYEKLLELKEDALTYYDFGKIEKGNEIMREIYKISNEINQNTFSKKVLKDKRLIVEVKKFIDKPEYRNAANKSKSRFSKLIKPIVEKMLREGTGIDNKNEKIKNRKSSGIVMSEAFNDETVKMEEDLEEAEEELSRILKIIVDGSYEELRNKGQYDFGPETPITNRLRYKNIINEAEKKIHIVDKYFTKSSLDLLLNTLDWNTTDVTEIKILTSKTRLDFKIDNKFRNLFKNTKEELKNVSNPVIDIQMKVIVDFELDNLIHSRYHISSKPENTFDIGSEGYIFEQNNTISRLNDLDGDIEKKFEKWWNHPGALDILKDWKKIEDFSKQQGNRTPREMHKATCDVCGNECKVPFEPDGERSVYCKDHFENRKNR